MGPGCMPTLSRICWKVSTTSMKSVLREKLIKSFAPPEKSPKDLSGLHTGTHKTKTPYIVIEESVREPTLTSCYFRYEGHLKEANSYYLLTLSLSSVRKGVAVLPVLIGLTEGDWSCVQGRALQAWVSVLLCISTKKIKNSSWKDCFESRRCLCPVPCDDFCTSCRLFLFALWVFKSSAQDMKTFTVSLLGRSKTKLRCTPTHAVEDFK